jgi:hypothetical protein
MKSKKIFLFLAIVTASCNQGKSPAENSPKIPSDILTENVKGNVVQIETNIYLIDSATGQQGKLESTTIEKYDDNGFAVSYSTYTAKDSSTILNTYEHNAAGNLTSMNTTKNGKPLSSMKLTADSTGKYITAVSFDSAGKEDVFYDDIVTNDFGAVLSAKGNHSDSTIKMTFANNYDSVYYIGGQSKDSVGKLTYSSLIKLNDKRDPMQLDEIVITKDSTTKTSTMYAYDKWDDKGNWTQQTTTENGKPKKMIIRAITYNP